MDTVYYTSDGAEFAIHDRLCGFELHIANDSITLKVRNPETRTTRMTKSVVKHVAELENIPAMARFRLPSTSGMLKIAGLSIEGFSGAFTKRAEATKI